MPRRALRPCCTPGCAQLVRSGRCAKHEAERQRVYDQQRGTAAQRGYGVDWQKLRREILERDPVCRMCHQRRSSHVDHRVPKRKGGTDDPSNLQGLCHSCHNSVKQRMEKGSVHDQKPAPWTPDRAQE